MANPVTGSRSVGNLSSTAADHLSASNLRSLPNNPVDGVVIRLLLNKAREIHQALGTHVPVSEESETVTQAVL
jgi:hypothetical protein